MPGSPLTALLTRLGLVRSNKGGPSRRTGHAAELGAWGEREAEKHLKSNGYAIVGRNMVTASGEADLVCRAPDGKTMVLVEVKARIVASESGLYRPERAINRNKSRRLTSMARLLRAANGWRDRPVRVDVVAVERIDDSGAARIVIRHHEGIVRIAPDPR